MLRLEFKAFGFRALLGFLGLGSRVLAFRAFGVWGFGFLGLGSRVLGFRMDGWMQAGQQSGPGR